MFQAAKPECRPDPPRNKPRKEVGYSDERLFEMTIIGFNDRADHIITRGK